RYRVRRPGRTRAQRRSRLLAPLLGRGLIVLPTDPLELEAAARERISDAAYAFYSYGCGAEQSLEDNVTAWRRWHVRPRVLRGHEKLSTETTVLGTEI